MITGEQVQFYQDNGYLMVEHVLSPDQLATMRQELADLVTQSAEVSENTDIYDLEDTHSAQEPRVRRIKTPHQYMPSTQRLTSDPKVVSILTRLIGPGVRFQTSKLNMKSSRYGASVEWHQDWAFYPHTNDDLLAVGVLLDDATEENGAMLVIPGSHKGKVYDHHADGYFCGAVDPKACDLDLANAVPLTGPAGSMSFHHVRLMHGSALNHSNHDRRLLLLQYTAADAFPLATPVKDLEAYDKMLVAGTPTVVPRLTNVPVRMPLPPSPHQGSIYENQRTSQNKYFETYQESTTVSS